MKRPRISLDRLVRQILLDVALLKWFATHDRRVEVLAAISLQRQDGDPAVLDFLEHHCASQIQNREE